jgi:PRTRC genetic system protein C
MEVLPRIFKYGQMNLEDIDPARTPEEIRDHYANVYPDLTQSTIEGPRTTPEGLVYEFHRTYGTKGNTSSNGGPVSVKDLAEGHCPFPTTAYSIRAEDLGLMEGLLRALNSQESDYVLPPSAVQGAF